MEHHLKLKNSFIDLLYVLIASVCVSFAFHIFINGNDFAPGGINGVASMIGYLSKINMGYFSLILDLPIFALVYIFVNKRTAVILSIYDILKSGLLILLEHIGFYMYITQYDTILAAIAGGLLSGFGFALMFKRIGASGGTYAISAIVKHFHPSTNMAWISFVLDSIVVFFSFFVYGNRIESVLYTLINLFIANYVVDYFLRGMKKGYKFEVVTETPEELSQELINKLHHSVTEIPVVGMYTHQNKYILICIVRKRQVGEFMRILKRYPGTFSYLSQVNEVVGKFI